LGFAAAVGNVSKRRWAVAPTQENQIAVQPLGGLPTALEPVPKNLVDLQMIFEAIVSCEPWPEAKKQSDPNHKPEAGPPHDQRRIADASFRGRPARHTHGRKNRQYMSWETDLKSRPG
jgi:hypothetical protein